MSKYYHDKSSRIFFLPYYHLPNTDVAEPFNLTTTPSVEDYFENFFGRQVVVTPNGTTAISVILNSLDLNPDDEVYIATSFDKPNVSSCVTCTIFNFCRPSRALTDKTKAIFVIHEFGVPHPWIDDLATIAKQKCIPLIEDCAHTLDSRRNGKMVGSIGDYVIYSLPKIFPVQYGGLLIGENLTYKPTAVQKRIIDEIRCVLPTYMGSIKEYSDKKRANFRSLQGKFETILLKPLYEVNEDISPSFFFPLVTEKFEAVIDKALQSGVDCGLWHGTNIVVLPAHQFLEEEHLERIFELVKSVY